MTLNFQALFGVWRDDPDLSDLVFFGVSWDGGNHRTRKCSGAHVNIAARSC